MCEPRITAERDPSDFFRAVPVDQLDVYCRGALRAGRSEHRLSINGKPACGGRYKRLLVDGVPLDLFSVLEPACWTAPEGRPGALTAGNKKALGFPGLLSGPPETRTRDPLIKRTLTCLAVLRKLGKSRPAAAWRGTARTQIGTPATP